MQETIGTSRKEHGFGSLLLKLKSNLSVLLLIFMFIIGMLYGVLLASGDGDLLEQLSFLTAEYTTGQQKQSVLQSFLSAFQSSFMFLLVSYLLGFSAIGQPGVLLIPFLKGLGLGAFMGNLYRVYGFQGFGYCVLMVVPYTLVALLAILIGNRESIKLSCMFFQSFASKHPVRVTGAVIKLYHIKYLVLCAILLLSSFINMLSVLLFARLFHFS